jgi:hypothetical protein
MVSDKIFAVGSDRTVLVAVRFLVSTSKASKPALSRLAMVAPNEKEENGQVYVIAKRSAVAVVS